MKRSLNILVSFTFVFVHFLAVAAVRAQQAGSNQPPKNVTNQTPFLGWRQRNHNLLVRAIPGSTPERKAAFNRLTLEQRRALVEGIRPYFVKALQEAKARHDADLQNQDLWVHGAPPGLRLKHHPNPGGPSETAIAFTDQYGNTRIAPAVTEETTSSSARWPESVLAQMGFRPSPRVASASKGVLPAPGTRAVPTSGRWHRVRPRESAANPPGRYPFRLAAFAGPAGSPGPVPQQNCGSGYSDADCDGLDDAFETDLANGFTPYYYVAQGEQDNFAIFNANFEVDEVNGQTPFSYFRVTPQNFSACDNGPFCRDQYNIEYGFIRIDYLTLWDADDGLAVGSDCVGLLAAGGVFDPSPANLCTLVGISAIAPLTGHSLDEEHSAALIMAPTVEPETFNPDYTQYTAISWFTAAHEGTFFDNSASVSVSIPADSHIQLWLSKSKHSTYTFNPDYMPLVPGWVMTAYYVAVDLAYADVLNCLACLVDYFGWFDYFDDPDKDPNYGAYFECEGCDYYRMLQYLALQYLGDVVFFDCIVEHMPNPIGSYAYGNSRWPSPYDTTPYAMGRVNVGELRAGNVLNNAGFILDTDSSDYPYFKLAETIWTAP